MVKTIAEAVAGAADRRRDVVAFPLRARPRRLPNGSGDVDPMTETGDDLAGAYQSVAPKVSQALGD